MREEGKQWEKEGERVEYERKKGRKEGNVLSNDALNSFYVWLYSVEHIVKNHHSDSEREKSTPTTTWAIVSY